MQKLIAVVQRLLPLGLFCTAACGGVASESGVTSQGGSAGSGATGVAGSVSTGGFAAGGALDGGAGAGSGDAGAGGLNCRAVACPGVIGSCAGGFHYGTPVGQCCSGCVPDSTNDCAQGQANYQDFRQTQIGFNDSCKTDSDCVLTPEDNDCTDSCGIPISVSAEASVVSKLSEYAGNNCATCPPPTSPPCIDFVVSCTNSACTSLPR